MPEPLVCDDFRCAVCDQRVAAAVTAWTFFCPDCDYWGSTLRPVTGALTKDRFLERAERDRLSNPIEYLDELRASNFRLILDQMSAWAPTSTGALLEVGCGPGLFLKEASARGLRAVGIEPYETMARKAKASGCDVRLGLFPDALEETERFDAIVFNDVFEHLPDARGVLLTCLRHLVAGGLVVLNMPDSHGLFFQVARQAARLGFPGSWERMWQKMFFSPHLHYWSALSIHRLCSAVGLERVADPIALAAVSRQGLWKRVRADADTALPVAVAHFAGASICAAAAPWFPPDCRLHLFRRP